jgi:ABC-type phosphate transport system substrate-binding protein
MEIAMERKVLVVATAVLLTAVAFAQEPGYKIIVNSANTTSFLSAEDVSKIFLKKVSHWPAGGTAQPVDQPESSPTRKRFSQEIHGKSSSAVNAFWQQQIFSGRAVPPPEKGTDEEVVAYVKANPNAIGYVAAGVSAPEVKVLKVGP